MKNLFSGTKKPKKAASLVVKTLPMLEEKGLADSIKHVQLQSINAYEAKEDLEFFFKVLENSNEKLIGGKLPNENIYYKSNTKE